MKKVILAIFLVLFVNHYTKAQSKIPPPSYADALKNLKASTSTWEELKKMYGVMSQADVKITEYNGQNYTYVYSTYAKPYEYKFPPDLVSANFIITTKKNTDGSYYEIPVSSVYRRSKYEYDATWGGNVISYTGAYTYYWCEIGAPVAIGKKMLSLEDRSKMFFNAIQVVYEKEKDPNNTDYGKCVVGTNLMNIVQFKEFSEYDAEELRVKTINAFEEKWQFNCIAIEAEFNEDKSKILNLTECKFLITANAKMVNGKWQIIGNSENERPFYFEKKEEVKEIYKSDGYTKIPYDTLYATLSELSVYTLSKKATAIPTPIASETEINEKVIKPLTAILNSKSTNQDELSKKLLPLFEATKASEYSGNMAKQIANWNALGIAIEDVKIELRRGKDDVDKSAANFREQFANKPIYISVFLRLNASNSKKGKDYNGKMYQLVNNDMAPEDYLGGYAKIGFDSEKGKWYLYGNLNELK
ncbi:MAG: hypothetical protein JNJ41_06380 [Bacteroidia bacterium]|nr:hypothetical protein [Bacteroidia bacterium]